MKFSRKTATTSKPVITRSLWNEIKSQSLHEISQKVLLHSIPDELIINSDQTPSKFVTIDNITMGAKWKKHISKVGSSNKSSITLTVCKSLDDDKILPLEQRKNTKKKHKDCSQPLISPMVFVYRKMKNIEVMRRRLSVLLAGPCAVY